MEKIIYSPPTLESMLISESGRHRLRNREGKVEIKSPLGEVSQLMEGALLDAHQEALLFQSQNPDYKIRVIENSCQTVSL
ncbi:MAG: hypothetical protein M1450_05485 [Patescibacteria group bacterium]|nr:hypothetical protein [Patescibacteria group bacterium]